MQEQQNIERIEAYLTGSMTAAGRTAFEADLAADPALKALFDQHTKAHTVINHAYNRELKQRLVEIDATLSTPQTRIRPMYRRVAVAASIIVLACLGAWLWSGSSYSNDVMADHYFFEDTYDVMRSADQAKTLNIDSLLTVAQDAFNAEEYATAEAIYTPLLSLDTEYRDQIEWNLLMCSLVQNDDNAAIDEMLDDILNEPDHAFYSQAKKLKRKMNHPFYRWRK